MRSSCKPAVRPAGAAPGLRLLVLTFLVVLARDALALTPPLPGAVALPANAALKLPFPAGSEVLVLSGYGPNMGSSLHQDTNAPAKANDHYALDLQYSGEPNGGKGLPIVAALAGEVVKAGWATEGWANYGLRVILKHDLGDGHVYHSLYAHLNAIDPAVVEGGVVAQGQTLGELGQSCQGALSCGSFSNPHLHWALHRDSLIGGSGTGGSYGGNAVVPEPFDGHEDLVKGMVLTSSNTGTPVCGDGYCSRGEDGVACPSDCCAPIPPQGRIVDDTDPCFVAGGNPMYLYTTDQGWDGGAIWTHATDAAAVDDSGSWNLDLVEAGEYAVRAYAAPGFAGTKSAAYVISHGGTDETVTVDQSASGGWIDLGTFSFEKGASQSVFLGDVTGEPLSEMKPIVFDAVELTRVGGAGGSGGSAAGGGDPGTGGTGAQGGGSGGGPEGGAAGSGGDGGGDGGGSGTCNCRAAGTPSRGGAAAGIGCVLAGLALRRRRRPRAAPGA